MGITPSTVIGFALSFLSFITISFLVLLALEKLLRNPLKKTWFFLFFSIAYPIALLASIALIYVPMEHLYQKKIYSEKTLFILPFFFLIPLSFSIFAFLAKISLRLIGISWKRSLIYLTILVTLLTPSMIIIEKYIKGNLTTLIMDRIGGEYEQLGYDYKKNRLAVKFKNDTMLGADPNTLEVLGDHTAKDKNHAYKGANKIENIDAESYHVVEGQPYGETIYTADKNRIYYLGMYVLSKKPENFKVLSLEYRSMSVEGEPDGFKIRTYASFATDGTITSFNGVPMPEGTDPNSFKPLGWYVAKDARRLYIGHETVENCECDLSSLEMVSVENGIAKDGNDKFLFLYDLPDRDKFQFFKNGFKKDGNFNYYDNIPAEEHIYEDGLDPSAGQNEYTNIIYFKREINEK